MIAPLTLSAPTIAHLCDILKSLHADRCLPILGIVTINLASEAVPFEASFKIPDTDFDIDLMRARLFGAKIAIDRVEPDGFGHAFVYVRCMA